MNFTLVSRKKTYRKDKEISRDLENISENTGLISFPHHLGSAVVKPEDKGKIKGRAIAAMKEQTERQMAQLYNQMKVLSEQANHIKERVRISEKIYLAQINFEPVIGHTYYLYLNEEWGYELPFTSYQATVRLLADHTWEVVDRKF